MKTVQFHYNYPLNIRINTDRNVNVYIDRINPVLVPKNDIKIMILEEPKKGNTFSFAMNHKNRYTHLLTFHEELLETNEKARLFHCTNSWVTGYVPEQKKFCVSTVVGGKNDPVMEGYAVRHNIWKLRKDITIPIDFYLSGNYKWPEGDYANEKVLGASKTPLFDSMFHISIENTSIKNYFSEKIIDCFQTKTVPIYYGCKNIGDFFNADGILIAKDAEDIIKICNSVNPKLYQKMLPAMEDNYQRSMKWLDHDQQIKDAVVQILNEST
jgi:hypothetical protein